MKLNNVYLNMIVLFPIRIKKRNNKTNRTKYKKGRVINVVGKNIIIRKKLAMYNRSIKEIKKINKEK